MTPAELKDAACLGQRLTRAARAARTPGDLAVVAISADELAELAGRLRQEPTDTSCTKENVAKLIRDRYAQTLAGVIVQRWSTRDLKRLVAAIEKRCPSARGAA